MPITPTYPGIYIQEAPSSTHTIIAAPTNIAVFIGYTHPLKTPYANFGQAIELFGFTDYQRFFGGFVRNGSFAKAGDAYAIESAGIDPTTAFGDMAQAVNNFFLNGGTQAYVVGLLNTTAFGVSPLGTAGATGPTGATVPVGPLVFTALELTDSAFPMTVQVRVNQTGSPPLAEETADITITYGPGVTQPGASGTVVETYRRVNMIQGDPNYALTRLATSQLVSVKAAVPPAPFLTGTFPVPPINLGPGSLFDASDFTKAFATDSPLDKVLIFNLMSIPGVTNMLVLSTALAFCETKRAFLIVDPIITDAADYSDPVFTTAVQDDAEGNTSAGVEIPKGINEALYFPYLTSPDPITGLKNNAVTGHLNEVPPSPVVAGIYAGTDVARGVWKAPAGLQAVTNNITGVAARGRMTDMRQGILNDLSINCLREFPGLGAPIVYGARTFQSSDEQWRYVPVRRMALFLEQTLYANLKWVVFEPNAEPLWSAITMSINAFMLGLFRQNAFAGTTPSNSFNVTCNSQTTTQTDVNQGIVNIVVAFAPLKPAEFVIVTIAQLAGQTATS